MKPVKLRKILIVGNAAGGKTKLSRRLSQIYGIPVTHVDSIQFLPGMKIRALDETRRELARITDQDEWIIDGHGPLDQIEARFLIADRIVFVDLPIYNHYWWALKRQIQSFWQRRAELPDGCRETTWNHTQKLFKTIHRIHYQMRPQLIRIFSKDDLKDKVIPIRSVKDWNRVFLDGVE